jgi:hypothetical protein
MVDNYRTPKMIRLRENKNSSTSAFDPKQSALHMSAFDPKRTSALARLTYSRHRWNNNNLPAVSLGWVRT